MHPPREDVHDSNSTSSKITTFLFVAVLTTAHNRERRDAVRESWASEAVPGAQCCQTLCCVCCACVVRVLCN